MLAAGCQTYGAKYSDVRITSPAPAAQVCIIPHIQWVNGGREQMLENDATVREYNVASSTPVVLHMRRHLQVIAVKSDGRWNFVEYMPHLDAETISVPGDAAPAK